MVCTVVLRSGVHCEFMFHYWSWTDGEGGRGVEGVGEEGRWWEERGGKGWGGDGRGWRGEGRWSE